MRERFSVETRLWDWCVYDNEAGIEYRLFHPSREVIASRVQAMNAKPDEIYCYHCTQPVQLVQDNIRRQTHNGHVFCWSCYLPTVREGLPAS